MPDLLIELFSEEIPARMQARAADDLKRLVCAGLTDAGLSHGAATAFVTPRRLALAVERLAARSPDRREERRGPRVGAPEKALEGFLRATGLSRDRLEQREDKKGPVWFAVIERPGRPAAEIVAEVLDRVIRDFPWPKSMRWGAGSLRWVRPLHGVLCILSDEAGAQVVPMEIDGIRAGDTTRGHRFMDPEPFAVTGFEDYRARLARAHVLLDPEDRAATIWHDAENLAFARGMELVEDKGLLAEVAGLVEWPVVLMGEIGAEFLELPPEVLQTSMREHQKFFSLRNPGTGRIEGYVTVANRETTDGGATILAGNARVLAARLADAKFFWENDLRTVHEVGLEGMAEPLKQVTFHARLGTQAERIERIAALARELAAKVGASPDLAAEAARVAKADLASQMVYEFPELQGVMGRYYAQEAGLGDGIPEACEEHYRPLGPNDDLPSNPVATAVALADKIDMLTGFWAIDEKPTGSGDPYALRRAALGVIRVVLTAGVRLQIVYITKPALARVLLDIYYVDMAERLKEVKGPISESGFTDAGETFLLQVEGAAKAYAPDDAEEFCRLNYPGKIDSLSLDLLAFFHDRLKVHLRGEGIRHDVIDACLGTPGNDDLVLLVNRVRALQAFVDTEDGANLLTGYRRASNILAVEEKKDGVAYEMDPDAKFAEDEAERSLFAALDAAQPAIDAALQREDFAAAMAEMARLRAPIDRFFDEVLVNADNPILRRNRLCLLNRIRVIMGRVADFSAIAG